MIKDFLSSKIKSQILRVVLEYKEKRDQNLSLEEREKEREFLAQIKKQILDNIDEIKTKTIKNLKKNRIFVYEAKDKDEAGEKIRKLVDKEKIIIKSKSNITKEIEIKKILKDKEVIETDTGDFINNLLGKESLHPVMPAFYHSPEEIASVLSQKLNQDIKPNPEAIVDAIRKFLRKKIAQATVGISGANFITEDGRVVILENEGNISLVSRWPAKHIIITGVEKIVPDLNTAIRFVKASAVWGTGQDFPVYVSIISGPSKTGDIENRLVVGAQGAKEVHLIFVDNGRSALIRHGFGELLYCINCGACLNFCPVFLQIGKSYGDKYLGSKGIIFTAFSESLEKAKQSNCFACTLCSACYFNCPLKINLPQLMRRLRTMMNQNGLETEANKEMIKNIRETGNPFGRIEKDKTPDKLYCC